MNPTFGFLNRFTRLSSNKNCLELKYKDKYFGFQVDKLERSTSLGLIEVAFFKFLVEAQGFTNLIYIYINS